MNYIDKMTPKEKAIELIKQYTKNGLLDKYMGITSAKICSLIAVNEIIKEMSSYYDEYDCTETLDKVNYWIEVKKELEK